MNAFDPIFVVRDVGKLILQFLPLRQLQWWIIVASRDFAIYKLTIDRLLDITDNFDVGIYLDLFEYNCVDILERLYASRKFNLQLFVASTWQRIFYKKSTSLGLRIFCWSFVPHAHFLSHLHKLPLHHFKILFTSLALSDQQIVFSNVCKYGHDVHAACCAEIAKKVNRDILLLDLFDFPAPTVFILKLLEHHGVSFVTLDILRLQCRLKIQQFFRFDIELMHVLQKWGVIEPEYHKQYFARAVQYRSQPHMQFFWNSTCKLELYFPIIESDLDDRPDEDCMFETTSNEDPVSTFDILFQSLIQTVRIPEDMNPAIYPPTLNSTLVRSFASIYKNLDDVQITSLFLKCCLYSMCALAQYIWLMSSQSLRKLLAPSLSNNISKFDADFLEFAWSNSSSSVFINNAQMYARSALQHANFALWQFLHHHQLLHAHFITDDTFSISRLCSVDVKFLKTVWDQKEWMEHYPTFLKACVESLQTSEYGPDHALSFLMALAIPLPIPFLLDLFPLFLKWNLVPFVKQISSLNDHLCFDMPQHIQFAIQMNYLDMFHELVRLQPLTYVSNPMLELILNSETRDYLQWVIDKKLIHSSDVNKFLLEGEYWGRKTLEHLNYDVDFLEQNPPSWWN